MNKKGYTLIEIIVVIALVATVGLVGAIGLTKIITNSKQTRYDDMINDLEGAALTYFTIYSEYPEYADLKTDLYTSHSVVIPIETLKEALLVDQNQKNPKDNSAVHGVTRIYIENDVQKVEVILCQPDSSFEDIAEGELSCANSN